jgi:hypothetical protein
VHALCAALERHLELREPARLAEVV